MAIKQIQLRGISRAPSDRMTRDGGLAESLNVQLEGGELAPMRIPSDVTEDILGEGASPEGNIIFIHQGSGYTNYVEQYGGSLYVWSGGVRSLLCEGMATDIQALGNALAVRLQDRMAYFVRDTDGYTDLGDGTVDLDAEFYVEKAPVSGYGHGEYREYYYPEDPGGASRRLIWNYDVSAWNRVLQTPEADLTETQKEMLALVREYQAMFWAKFDEMKEHNRQWGYFSVPVLARYAVRLFDGSYVNVSPPVILGASNTDIFTVKGRSGAHSYKCEIGHPWKAYLSFRGEIPEKWKDLVQSVDIFLSQDIIFPAYEAEVVSAGELDGDGESYVTFRGCETGKKDEAALDEFLSASNFYRVASLSVEQIQKLRDTGIFYNLLTEKDNGLDGYRESQPRLPEDTRWGIVPNAMRVYNGRLLALGASRTLSAGYHWMFGPAGAPSDLDDKYWRNYRIRFFLKIDGKEYCVDAVAPDGSAVIRGSSFTYGWAALFFPDIHCYKAEFLRADTGASLYTIEMKEHPHMNCSYAFLGYGAHLTDIAPASATEFSGDGPSVVKEDYKLMMTKTDNFLVYDLGNTVSFSHEVIDAVPIPKALITYPYGRGEIYVFTKGGIFTISVLADGSFGGTSPHTRDVALPGTVTMIDHAIVFITERGVMLQQDGSLDDISAVMKGRHDGLDASVRAIFPAGTRLHPAVEAVADDTPFMTFMRDARPAYDYAGARLIFFSDSYRYQYVYMLGTMTWHKMYFGLAGRVNVLNSHPQCLASHSLSTPLVRHFLTVSDVQGYPYVSEARESIAAAVARDIPGMDREIAYRALDALPASFNILPILYEQEFGLLKNALDGISCTYLTPQYLEVQWLETDRDREGVATLLYVKGVESSYQDAYDALGSLPAVFDLSGFSSLSDWQDLEFGTQGGAEGLRSHHCTYVLAAELRITSYDDGGVNNERRDLARLFSDPRYGICSESEAYDAMAVLPHEFMLPADMTDEIRGELLALLDSTYAVTFSEEERIVGEQQTSGRLVDYSTLLADGDYQSDTGNTVDGIVVTRPLDFDSPDIRKAVKDLEVRGAFNRGDVKWRLLGSLDGHSWKVLSSLRGGSYKWFRLVLVATLAPTERISWVDMDVEDRYTRRLR